MYLWNLVEEIVWTVFAIAWTTKTKKKKCGQGQMEDQGQKIFSWECDQNILNVFFKTKLKMH